MNSRDELLDKGFRLAGFIVPNRQLALQVLGGAMSKLKVQQRRESKRAYWRDKHLKGKITKVIRHSEDMLQWLLYVESEKYEKQQELAGEHDGRELVIRYVKYLVQITTAMSSFYVNIGLQRILRNYTTAEVGKLSDEVNLRCPGAEECRKIKSVLMKKLEARFHNSLTTHKAQRGELRFEASEEQQTWRGLVDDCLKIFTPWSTAKSCLTLGDGGRRGSAFRGQGRGATDQDAVEMYRCHLFIDPPCYAKLTKYAGLDSPNERLAVPKFLIDNNSRGNRKAGPRAREIPRLTEAERRHLLDRVDAEVERGLQVCPRKLTFLVDGIECASLKSDETSVRFCEIEEGAKSIEIWAEEQGTAVLYATHWLDYTHSRGFAEGECRVDLGHGRELVMTVIQKDEVVGEPRRAVLRLKCELASHLTVWPSLVKSHRPPRLPVPGVCRGTH